MSFEPVINHLSGQFGLYQFLTLSAFGIHINAIITIQLFIPVFVEYKQEYGCMIKNKSQYGIDKCHLLDNSSFPNLSPPTLCDEFTFNESVFESTIRRQYNLVCNNEWKVSMGSTALMLGKLFGGLVFGMLSDRFGRFLMLMLACYLLAVCSLSSAFVPYFWAYVLMRCLIGFSAGGLYLIPCTYLSEIAPSSKRLHYLLLSFCGLSTGGIVLTIIAYYERNHFYIQIICVLLLIPTLIYPLIFTESPRWLAVKGYTEKALSACRKISRINRRPFMNEDEFRILCDSVEKESGANNQKHFWKAFHYPRLRIVILVVWYSISVGTFTYYLIGLGSGSFGSNVFVNFGSMFLLEMPFRLIGFILSRKFGRIKLLIGLHCICASSIMASGVFVNTFNTEIIVTVLSLIARESITVAMDLTWVYKADIFPTVARSSLIGGAGVLSCIACLFSPQMENLMKIWPPLPFLICGIFSLIAALLTWIYLPETFKMRTKDYLDETEEFIQLSKHSCCSRECLCCKAVDDLTIDVETSETENY